MKYLVFSDLHGSAQGLVLLRDAVIRENPDIILCLGDILYGAYDGDINACSEYLLSVSSRLIAVRGNCDWSYDQARIGFALPEERVLKAFGHTLYLQHTPFWRSFKAGDIAISGHTHVKTLFEENGVIHLNPGSIGKPRDGSHSYATIDENGTHLIDAENGETLEEIRF